MPLSDQQKFRAARAILGWSQPELCRHARISSATVSQFELGNREMSHNNKMACWKAFADNGIHFVGDTIRYSPPIPAAPPTPNEETTTHAG